MDTTLSLTDLGVGKWTNPGILISQKFSRGCDMGVLHNPATAPTWETTILWAKLCACRKRDGVEVATVLRTWMPQIESVLKRGGTSPADFTLHDEGHGYRVAERMVEIMSTETVDGLSPYELAFLLLSAYLHDIGMTPESRKVSLHYQYLLSGKTDALLGSEVEAFQRWLDDDQQGLTPPLCVATPTPDELRRANRLVAHYCRHRHNDWSAEWIHTHGPKLASGKIYPLGTFDDWVDDLIRLCRSHHFGWEELILEHFNPRLVGNPGQVLHMRYLACVLRVADVLEFDPERTPEVVLSHRDISPASMIYWHKDHGVSPRFEDGRLILSARPDCAWLYRAVEEMLDQIDNELILCRTLSDQTHFEICPGLREPQPYRWVLGAPVHRDVKPKPDTFVYINSAFRPNTEKILQIFSGIELYGDPLAAVRELLQNAFDAVRERIAYQRLRQPNATSPTLELELGRQHKVELRLERRADGPWLVCVDTGIGMSKLIIENYLLVSGQARRHDLAELERRCRAAGFTTGRTGQFGIGVLSYFMVADRLRIATRRGSESKDADARGWTFESEGIGSWGELRPSPNLDVGSRIELHLREDVLEYSAEWYAILSTYLQRTLIRVPCEFQLNASLAGSEPLSLPAGWTHQPTSLESVILNDMRHREGYSGEKMPEHLLPEKEQQDAVERDQHWGELRVKARDCLRWVHEEGDLQEGVGRYRLHLPYFDLLGGPSLAFFDIERRNGEMLLGQIGKGFVYPPTGHTNISWKGMTVHADIRRGGAFPRIQCEVDFHDARTGTIAVNRSTMQLTEFGLGCLKWLADRAETISQEFVVSNRSSCFASFNARRTGTAAIRLKNPHWITRRQDNADYPASWGIVRFPAIDSRVFMYSQLPERMSWKGIPVMVLPCAAGPADDDHYDGLGWDFDAICPHRIVRVQRFYRDNVAPLWENNPRQEPSMIGTVIRQSNFPPAWKEIVGVAFSFHRTPVWNRRHKVVRLVSEESWRWAQANQQGNNDPLELQAEILKNPPRAAAWILRMLELRARDLWRGLIDRDAEFLHAVWRALFSRTKAIHANPPLAMWHEESTQSRLRVISPTAWDVYDSFQDNSAAQIVERLMPDPGPNWTLRIGSEADALIKQHASSGPRGERPSRKSALSRSKTPTKRK